MGNQVFQRSHFTPGRQHSHGTQRPSGARARTAEAVTLLFSLCEARRLGTRPAPGGHQVPASLFFLRQRIREGKGLNHWKIIRKRTRFHQVHQVHQVGTSLTT